MTKNLSNIINYNVLKTLSFLFILLSFGFSPVAQKPRARDLGIPFEGRPGKFNAITDVPGVEVGYSTIIRGEGKNVRGY